MSAAAASGAATTAAPPAKGRKKLIILVATALLVAAGAGGGGLVYMKKKAAEAAAAEADDDDAPLQRKPARHAAAQPPAFLPLEPFIVNLADKEVDRYAQIGVTLELDDAKTADQLKAYMPAIRNGILMVLAHKNSAELLERKGKETLAAEIMREAVKPLGIEIDGPEADAEDAAAARGKKKTRAEAELPVKHVHFSNFIIQ
ncbi:flagellar basal body-associated protein FliL [Piscinibacter sp.]|uniref:flagellar basal body-associated FliL family protein n=1 Tax=Piscinibacter sp. TaxID=1903157 RepID=UPI0039E29D28